MFKNREERLAYYRRYYQKNKRRLQERNKETCRDWYQSVGKALRQSEGHKSARKISQRKYYERTLMPRKDRRLQHLIDLLGGKCAHCGRVDLPLSFDFHHVDPKQKSFSIASKIRRAKWEIILAEAKKCTLVCCICHRKLRKQDRKPRTGKNASGLRARDRMYDRLVDKLGGKCSICGLVDDVAVYDFHHRDPKTKTVGICSLVRRYRKWDRIWAEAQKCVLLCCICHRKLHKGLVRPQDTKVAS